MSLMLSTMHRARVALLAMLLLSTACATTKPGGAEPSGAIACRLTPDSAMPERADPKWGVTYDNRHGLYFEPCVGSDGRPYNHYVFWDGADYIILGNNEAALDPRGLDKEPQRGGFAFYEASEAKVVCEGNRCKAPTKLVNLQDRTEARFALDWVGCKASERMELLDFTTEGALTVSCASFQVKGEVCRQAVGSFQTLFTREKFTPPPGMRLTDTVCD